MELVPYGVYSGEENMRIDNELLELSIAQQKRTPIFRLYGWSPKCVSLGKNQKLIQLPHDIDVVRRLTGGRALLHDNEVTYSYITPVDIIPNGETITESYKYISSILIKFFKTLEVELEFGENKKISTHYDYCMLLSTGADVCYKGQKIIGSAQYRKNGYILQHGSILFDYEKDFLEQLFQEEVKGITTVKDILPKITKNIFIQKFEHFVSQL